MDSSFCNVNFLGDNSFTNNIEAIYAEHGAIIFNGTNTFEDILISALVVRSSKLEFYGSIVFRRNLIGFLSLESTVLINAGAILERSSCTIISGSLRSSGEINFLINNRALLSSNSMIFMKGNVSFLDNYSDNGGAVYISDSTLHLEGVCQ